MRGLLLSSAMLLAIGCTERPAPPSATASSLPATAATQAPTATAPATAAPAAPAATGNVVELPDGAPGIGFDDLRFSTAHGLMIPAARTGRLDLLDTASGRLTAVEGFTVEKKYDGGHDTGITSVDEGAGLLFAVDRSTRKLAAIDPRKRAVVASAPLAAGPDYVRWVAPTGEVWVTEPDTDQLEIFSLDAKAPKLARAAVVKIAGGPESLVVDAARGRAYTNTWKIATYAIDLKTRAIAATWTNGCAKSRGLALDAAAGQLFVGCGEGGAAALDVTSGKPLGAAKSGAGVDIIDYSPSLRHLYVPGEAATTMAIMGVSAAGQLTVLGTVPIAAKGHCVTTDGHGTAWVCDPDKGRLLVVKDAYPASK